METASFAYPPMPKGVDERIIQPSADFRKEVIRVAATLLLFAFVYLLLMTVAGLLALLCAVGGVLLIAAHPSFITLMLGLGLAGLGMMVIYFLVKFIFKRHKVDASGMIEISEAEQPDLYAFIRRLTEETQTPFPKKIFLSPDVNAAVFYDSGFWSMFFPVRKNLLIGLGLVNSVNITELKAVLAHEFGHFSQRSMKLGSYVYNINKVIYNLLYDNEGYDRVLRKWADLSGYFALFATITVKIVQAIQWVLQKVYALVNRNYAGLSQQMEFHADSVAAYVSGSAPLISTLRRLEASDICYDRLFNRYQVWYNENLRPENIYPQHREVMMHFSDYFKIPVQDGLPQVTAQSLAFFNRSRVVIKDQWASHPSNDDREKHLRALNIPSVMLHQPAWTLFRDAEQLQRRMTDKVFEDVEFRQTPSVLNVVAFLEKYRQDVDDSTFHRAYKGYYDSRDLAPFDPEAAIGEGNEADTFEALLDETHCNLPGWINGLQEDIQTLEAITGGNTGIKTFDFEGQKYDASDAYVLLPKLKQELERAQQQLAQQDKRLFRYFYGKALEQGRVEELKAAYTRMFEATQEAEKDLRRYNQIMQEIQPIYVSDQTFEDAKNIIRRVKDQEKAIRERMKQMLDDAGYTAYITPEQQARLTEYLAGEREYFSQHGFDNEALQVFGTAMGEYASIAGERAFKIKKNLLNLQIGLLD